jgi:ATP/maltotriose-dependent transcriptional regulator MalT
LIEGGDVAAPLRARALYAFASLSFYRGDLSRATALAQESLSLFRELDDERNMVLVLHGLGHVALAQHRPADVLDLTAETLPLVRKMEDRWKTAEALFLSAFGYCAHEEYIQARVAVEESLALWRKFEYHHALAHTQQIAGYVAYKQGRLEAARSYYRESLATAQLEPDYWLMTACLVGLGEVAAEQGQWTRAAQLWGAEEALRETITIRRGYVARLPGERVVARTHAHLGEEAFSAAWLQGPTLPLERVLSVQDRPGMQGQSQHLVNQDPHSTRIPGRDTSTLPPTTFDELTAREVEVLRLIAQGLTNAQIADQLVLSPLTINTYVRAIYRKLGIRSRSAATRYVLEHGLTL